MSTMIRGYGLPSDAAGSYNGYGAYGRAQSRGYGYGYGRAVNPLFRTLPDSQLGQLMHQDVLPELDLGHFGEGDGEVFDARTNQRVPHYITPWTGGAIIPATGRDSGSGSGGLGSGGLGIGVLAVGALALFFFFR